LTLSNPEFKSAPASGVCRKGKGSLANSKESEAPLSSFRQSGQA